MVDALRVLVCQLKRQGCNLEFVMTQQEIQDEFPELTSLAVLTYAADREHQVYSLNVQ